ncbi:MAG: hypothetical protein H6852_00820 [Geminicoccaceae bacterium]|nr:hypothetical protein [Geminicoccaceae bacterium]
MPGRLKAISLGVDRDGLHPDGGRAGGAQGFGVRGTAGSGGLPHGAARAAGWTVGSKAPPVASWTARALVQQIDQLEGRVVEPAGAVQLGERARRVEQAEDALEPADLGNCRLDQARRPGRVVVADDERRRGTQGHARPALRWHGGGAGTGGSAKAGGAGRENGQAAAAGEVRHGVRLSAASRLQPSQAMASQTRPRRVIAPTVRISKAPPVATWTAKATKTKSVAMAMSQARRGPRAGRARPADAGRDVDEAGERVEPENEGHGIADRGPGLGPAEERSAAGEHGGDAEDDGDDGEGLQQAAAGVHVGLPPPAGACRAAAASRRLRLLIKGGQVWASW